MIIVTVQLLSANTGEVTTLGRMTICNDGGTTTTADYVGEVMRKPDFKTSTRKARVTGHKRLAKPIWTLVANMLKAMGYDKL